MVLTGHGSLLALTAQCNRYAGGHLPVRAGHLQESPSEHRSWLLLSEADDASMCLAAFLYNGEKLLDAMMDYRSSFH